MILNQAFQAFRKPGLSIKSNFLLVPTVVLLFLLSGCSSSSDDSPDPAADGGPAVENPPPNDPAPTDPPADPAPTDPPADPAPTDPPADPAPTDPPADPAPTDPPADPAPTDPPADPAPADPPADPAPADPPADPAPADPPPADPPADPAPPATTGTVRFINLGTKPESLIAGYAAVKVGTLPIQAVGEIEPGKMADIVTSDCDQELDIRAWGDDFRDFLKVTETLACGETLTYEIDTDSVPPQQQNMSGFAINNTGEIPGSVIARAFVKLSSDTDYVENVLTAPIKIGEQGFAETPACETDLDILITTDDGSELLELTNQNLGCTDVESIDIDPDDAYHPTTNEASIVFQNTGGTAEVTFVQIRLASNPGDTGNIERAEIQPGQEHEVRTSFYCNTRVLLSAEDNNGRQFLSEPRERALACGESIQEQINTDGTLVVVNTGTGNDPLNSDQIFNVQIIFTNESGNADVSDNLLSGGAIEPGTTQNLVTQYCNQDVGYRFLGAGSTIIKVVDRGVTIPCDGELTVSIDPSNPDGAAGSVYLRNTSDNPNQYIASVYADSASDSTQTHDLLGDETISAGSAAVLPLAQCGQSLILEGAGDSSSVLRLDTGESCGQEAAFIDITFDDAGLLQSVP